MDGLRQAKGQATQLLAAGVPFCGEPEAQAWGGVLATLLDRAGNSLQLVQHPRERTEGPRVS